jgi:hypothetical protein
VTDLPFKFDEIGYWSELKLEIVEKYGAAYTKAFAKTRNLKKYYIDGFSGAGVHVSKKTGARIEGSPARALKVQPPFDGFCFIDLIADKTEYLRAICGDRHDVDIHTGDSNEYLTQKVLPAIQYKKFTRATVSARSVCPAARLGSDSPIGTVQGRGHVSQFPVMDMNRNAIWKNPEKVPQSGVDRMNKFWGDESFPCGERRRG